MQVNEDFFHYVWLFRLFNQSNLQTDDGESVRVISPGIGNTNSGPDFSDAHLWIGDTEWAGSVEIHINASDWLSHGHQHDAAYNNVILHVVYENDVPINRPEGSILPVISLRDKIHPDIWTRYENLITAPFFFPCKAQIGQVDPMIILNQLTKMSLERLVEKSAIVVETVQSLAGDWESAFYYLLARNFGFRVNALPFEMLAKSLPYKIIVKHSDQPLQVAALLFGQAGFLSGAFKDAYPIRLKKEYQFLQKKYELCPIDRAIWKFMRMRPQNFPTIRLAQFAAILTSERNLFTRIMEAKEPSALLKIFDSASVDTFWNTHFHFSKTTDGAHAKMGKQSIFNILINTVSVFLFAYGRFTDQEALMIRAFDLLHELPPESNKKTAHFENAGVTNSSACDSQAIIQLFQHYCAKKRCLKCSIGVEILKQKNPVPERTETR